MEKIYSLYYKIKDFWINLKWYFKNIHRFRHFLYEFRPWDHSYCVDAYIESLKQLKDQIAIGFEETNSKNKKMNKIQELIDLLKQYDNYEDIVDEKIGYLEHFKNVKDVEEFCNKEKSEEEQKELDEKRKQFNEACKKFLNDWHNSIMQILIGQDNEELAKLADEYEKSLTDEQKKKLMKKYKDTDLSYITYTEVFDGSGCRSWWE